MRNKNISHTANAVEAAQYFAKFFINEARKSDHHFKNSATEDQFVIYNFPPSFTGAKGSAFEQSYMFPEDVQYNTGEATSSGKGIYCSFISLILCLTVLKFV